MSRFSINLRQELSSYYVVAKWQPNIRPTTFSRMCLVSGINTTEIECIMYHVKRASSVHGLVTALNSNVASDAKKKLW